LTLRSVIVGLSGCLIVGLLEYTNATILYIKQRWFASELTGKKDRYTRNAGLVKHIRNMSQRGPVLETTQT